MLNSQLQVMFAPIPNLVFSILIILTAIYFLLFKSEIDGYSLIFAGVLFYFLPAILGKGRGGISGHYSIHWKTWIFVNLFVLLLVITSKLLVGYTIEVESSGPPPNHNYYILILTLFSVSCFAIMVLTYDFSQFGSAKAAIRVGVPGRLYRFLGPVAFITSIYYRKKILASVFLFTLIVHMFLFQIRSPFAFAILSALLFVMRQRNLSIPDRVKHVTIGGLIGFAVIFFDKTKGQIFRGEFDHLLQAGHILNRIIWFNNGHNIFHILNKTLETGYRLNDPINHLSINILQIIPFGRTVLGIPTRHFGHIFKINHFPSREAGIAGNIWAEGYALGGVLGLGVLLALFFGGIVILNGILRSSSPPLNIYALVVMPYVTFFIHRMTIGEILNVTMILFLLSLGPWIILKYICLNNLT